MRKYEALIILNMKGNSSSVEEVVQSIADQLKAEGANIEKTENLGRREFAYESHHTTAGQYVSFTFTAEPSVIRTARERLSIDTNIHQQYYRSVA